MEFRYGAADEPPPPLWWYQQPPPANNSYFSDQDIQAGYRRPEFGPGNEYFSHGFERANEYCGQGLGEANECFWNGIYIREAIQRKIEKERIREEIIAAEIARRQVLEAEVRAEMNIERELALRARGGSAFDRFSFPVGAGMGLEPTGIAFQQEVKGLSLEERIAMSADERIGLRARLETQRFETVPFQRGSAHPEIKEVMPSPSGVGNEKEKIVFLPKPNTHLSGAKRKAVSPAEESANELLSSRVANKKVKEEWNCAICQVRAASEGGLYEHIQGKKHKSKETAFMARRNGSNIGIGVFPKKNVKPILEVTHVLSSDKGLKLGGEVLHTNQKHSSLHIVSTAECSDRKNMSMLQESEKIGKLKKKKLVQVKRVPNNGLKEMQEFSFWGGMCQVGTYSANVLEEHMEGKKHSTQLQKAKENGQTIPTIQIVGIQGANDAGEVTKGRENEKFENVDGTANEEEEVLHANQSKQSSLHIVSTTECLDKKNVSMLQESVKIGNLKKKKLVQVQRVPNNRKKKMKKFIFGCEMCQVETSNANVMEQHIKGKKHLTRLQKAKENGQTIPAFQIVGIPRVPNNGQKKMKEFPFWCETCHVGTFSSNAMAKHIMGQKHSTRLQKAKENGQTIPTFHIVGMQGANDADEVTKERENEKFENVDGTANEEEKVLHTNQSEQSSLHSVSTTEYLDKKNMSILQESEKIGKLKKEKLVQVQRVPNNGQKKMKEFAFWCEMCQIGTCFANVMEEHIKGEKHSTRVLKAKENGQTIPTLQIVAIQRANDADEVTKGRENGKFENVDGTANEEDIENDDVTANEEEKLLHTNQSEQSSLHIVSTTEYLDKKNVSILQEGEKIGKLKTKKLVQVQRVPNNGQKKMKEFAFWCELCQVGTCIANVMEEHIKGKKHSTQLRKAKENGQTIPTLQIVGIQRANDADEFTKGRENEKFENVDDTANEEDIENDDGTANEKEDDPEAAKGDVNKLNS